MNASECKSYLVGDSFDEGLDVKFSMLNHVLAPRADSVEAICRGGAVIHVGCVDHLPLVEEKIKSNTWLHGRLSRVCSPCIGLDINSEGIETLRKKGIENIHKVNLEVDDVEFLRSRMWDHVVLGEMVEHLDNPTSFLTAVHSKLLGIAKKLVVTTPNGFYQGNFTSSLKGVEIINTDHRLWFTPFTLSKALVRAGFRDVRIGFAFGYRRPTPAVKRWMYARYPMLSQTLVATAEF